MSTTNDGALVVMTEDGAFSVPHCPPWCELPAVHHLSLWLAQQPLERGTAAIDRVHTGGTPVTIQTVGEPIDVVIGQSEGVGFEPGYPYLGDAAVLAGDEELTASQARQLAAALLDAADRLDQIVSA